jgi:hypothetical protein
MTPTEPSTSEEEPTEEVPEGEEVGSTEWAEEGTGDEGAEESGGEEVLPVPAIFPLDPDWILMLLFAILVDSVDIVIIILGFLDIWTISGWISLAIDIGVFAIIGGWMFWRTGQIIKSKKQQQEALVKRLEAQMSRLQKLGKKNPAVEKALGAAQKQLARFARPIAKVLAKVGIRAGASVAGESGCFLTAIPVLAVLGEALGLIPFWTISMFLILGERGE